MPDSITPPESREPTRLEQELDAARDFRFRDLFEHRPPEGICIVCQQKHFEWGATCFICREDM